VSPREHSQALVALQLLFWAAALFAFVMAVLPHPPHVPANDKLQHMAAFATLGLLGRIAYPRLPALRLVVGLSLFGALIEVVQGLPAVHRDRDPLDWLADTIACSLVLLAISWWRARRR
jgi:hypothetical protein